MKKIILVATICVAGLASAKGLVKNHIENQPATVENKEVEKEKDSEKPLRQLCSAITVIIVCDQSQNFDNTYCWEEGNTASFQEAIHCYNTEYEMFNAEICGS